jgi:hypothetical protein
VGASNTAAILEDCRKRLGLKPIAGTTSVSSAGY